MLKHFKRKNKNSTKKCLNDVTILNSFSKYFSVLFLKLILFSLNISLTLLKSLFLKKCSSNTASDRHKHFSSSITLSIFDVVISVFFGGTVKWTHSPAARRSPGRRGPDSGFWSSGRPSPGGSPSTRCRSAPRGWWTARSELTGRDAAFRASALLGYVTLNILKPFKPKIK